MDTTSKFNKMTLKNFIKGTGTSRLQSLRLPRDLSLGGTNVQPKKVYKPNVNAVRKKNKHEKTSNSKSKKETTKEKLEKMKERFVQSTGVFSEGIGPNLTTPVKKDKKVCTVKEAPTQNRAFHNHIINRSRNITDFAQYDIKNDLSDSDNDEKLPFVPLTLKNNKLVEVKSEVKNSSDELPTEYVCETKISSPLLTLWQMPDSFSCRAKKPGDFQLSEMGEGQIGKIIVRKSGKFEIFIANTKLVLDSTLDTFCEDAVCLDTETKQCIVLGEVANRFVLSPDWSILI